MSKSEALASEVLSLKSDVSKYTLARTESLISDVLSFYSFDGTLTNQDDASKVLSSESHSMKTAAVSLSPTSTQYETAESASSISVYETASAASGAAADRSSSLSFDTATLQPESPQTLDTTDALEGNIYLQGVPSRN